MNLITPDGGLLFWMVLIFGIVLLILTKWGFPAITSAVERRSGRIAESLQKAEEIEKLSASAELERARLRQDAENEKAALLKEAAKTRDAVIAQARASAEKQAAEILEGARAQIRAEREAAMAQVRRDVAVLSVEVAEKILRSKLGEEGRQGAMIDKMLSETMGDSAKKMS